MGARLGGLRSALLALAVAALVLGGIGLELIVASDPFGQREVGSVLALVLGWLFAGTGLFAWSRRPENHVGRLMTAAGFAWLVAVLGVSSSPWIYILGMLGAVLPYAVLIHLLLAYPSGRLSGTLDRSVVAGAYFATTALQLPLILFSEPVWDCGECPDNPLFISEGAVGDAVIAIGDGLGVVLALGLLVALVRRWRSTVTARARGGGSGPAGRGRHGDPAGAPPGRLVRGLLARRGSRTRIRDDGDARRGAVRVRRRHPEIAAVTRGGGESPGRAARRQRA